MNRQKTETLNYEFQESITSQNRPPVLSHPNTSSLVLPSDKHRSQLNNVYSPILLHCSTRRKAEKAQVPKRTNENMYSVDHQFKSPMQIQIMCLPTSEELPKCVSHYMTGSLKLRADRIFVSNSLIYNIYFEVRKPRVTVEKISNPRLKHANNYYLQNSTKCTVELAQIEWKHVKMVTAHGSHQAVERVIVTDKQYKLKRIRPIKFRTDICSVSENKPKVNIETIKRLRRPQKDVIQLRSVNASQEPRKIKLMHQDSDMTEQFSNLNLVVSTNSTSQG